MPPAEEACALHASSPSEKNATARESRKKKKPEMSPVEEPAPLLLHDNDTAELQEGMLAKARECNQSDVLKRLRAYLMKLPLKASPPIGAPALAKDRKYWSHQADWFIAGSSQDPTNTVLTSALTLLLAAADQLPGEWKRELDSNPQTEQQFSDFADLIEGIQGIMHPTHHLSTSMRTQLIPDIDAATRGTSHTRDRLIALVRNTLDFHRHMPRAKRQRFIV